MPPDASLDVKPRHGARVDSLTCLPDSLAELAVPAVSQQTWAMSEQIQSAFGRSTHDDDRQEALDSGWLILLADLGTPPGVVPA
jgi:hypothetical protein